MADSVDASLAQGRFRGKRVLVTGASDRGIGGAIVERLAKEGAAVALTSRHQPDRLLKKLTRLGARHLWSLGDVTDGDDVARVVAAAVAAFGGLDVLVNNAGVERAQPLDEMADDSWQELVDVNLGGAVRMLRAVLPHLASPGGVVVNVASALAIGGCPGFSVYSAAKAGLIGLTQSLAWELAPKRQRIVAVAPALVHTPMIHKHIAHLTRDVEQQIERAHPLGMGLPVDVAAAVAFLASDEARWITGVTLPLGYAPSFPLPVEQFLG